MFQRGRFYNEIPLEGNEVIGEQYFNDICDFKNNGIGWGLNVNKNILEECIKEDSNAPYWAQNGLYDLRNPIYENDLKRVLEQMEAKM